MGRLDLVVGEDELVLVEVGFIGGVIALLMNS